MSTNTNIHFLATITYIGGYQRSFICPPGFEDAVTLYFDSRQVAIVDLGGDRTVHIDMSQACELDMNPYMSHESVSLSSKQYPTLVDIRPYKN